MRPIAAGGRREPLAIDGAYLGIDRLEVTRGREREVAKPVDRLPAAIRAREPGEGEAELRNEQEQRAVPRNRPAVLENAAPAEVTDPETQAVPAVAHGDLRARHLGARLGGEGPRAPEQVLREHE